MATATQQKILGAFYTADPVARFLVRWAIREGVETVLDPSCGDGAFLSAAAQRLRDLGNSKPQIWGVDVDPVALRASRGRSPESRLLEGSFFSLQPGSIPLVTTVVGNPPFIRYQTFGGEQRKAALNRARDAGVELPKLSSSWAPFIVHAATFLKRGGRLGMVAPAEIVHAQYARAVLQFLLRNFGHITVRMFQKKMFDAISEDTVLLLCEKFGEHCGWFSMTPETCIEDAQLDEKHTVPVDIEAVRTGKHRLTRYLLPAKARHLYESIAANKSVVRLGDAADVGIGYVTGCNGYFHLTVSEAKAWRIPSRWLAPAVLSLANFRGTIFRSTDWERLVVSGEKTHLLRIPPVKLEDLPSGLAAYIAQGKKRRVPEHFKCRVREPWYSVPHVRVEDAFLSYMSGSSPKLVRNSGGFVAPNTLHIVRLVSSLQWKPLVAGWLSSVTRLSCEVEGHPLGGGLLKLEPTEAERVVIALPYPKDAAALASDLDNIVRKDNLSAAQELADASILRRRLGLSGSECAVLRDAAGQLETWRMHK